MRILYLGSAGGTSLDRAEAYRRLGHEVLHIDPRRLLPATPWVDRVTHRLGGAVWSRWMQHALARRLVGQRFNLCHVNGGEHVTPAVMRVLRRHCPLVVNYNNDDPLGTRDGALFAAYRAAVSHYDLLVVVREPNVAEARALGARGVLRLRLSADEIWSRPVEASAAERVQWGSDVSFVGTWMPERGPFLCELLRLGVPLTIRGSHWHKAPEWPQLRHVCRGGEVLRRDYVLAIQCARISLGLLSKGNRDAHTRRSIEVPAIGSLLCAERTGEHLSMYREGEEAVFWSDAAECARLCHELLADEPRRAAIATAGQRRVQADGNFNEPLLGAILEALGLGSAGSGRRLLPH